MLVAAVMTMNREVRSPATGQRLYQATNTTSATLSWWVLLFEDGATYKRRPRVQDVYSGLPDAGGGLLDIGLMVCRPYNFSTGRFK